MTTIVDRLLGLGFELIPEPPDTIRIRWPVGPEPAEARALIDELRASKAEALAALTAAPARDASRWDGIWELARVSAVISWCDEEARRAHPWPKVWDWARRERADLVAAVDAALDAISAARQAKDVRGNIEACRRLQGAVQAAVDAYQALPAAGGGRVPA